MPSMGPLVARRPLCRRVLLPLQAMMVSATSWYSVSRCCRRGQRTGQAPGLAPFEVVGLTDC